MAQPVTRTRPQMRNYGIAQDDDGMLAWDWVDARMRDARNYWIAPTRPDGRPHAAPVWGVWLDGALYFGSGRGSRRARNITQNPAASVHLESGDEVVILEGTLREITDAALLAKVATDYGAKYNHTPDPANEPETVFYTLDPQTALAWLETDFPKTATRWTF